VGKFYPEYLDNIPSGPPKIWQRYQLVIPCADEEQMERLSEKVSEFCGHHQEILVGVTENNTDKLLAEVPFYRKGVGLKDRAAVDMTKLYEVEK